MLRGAQRLASSLLVQLDAACSSGSGWETLQRAGISGTAAAARRLYPPTEPVRPKDKEGERRNHTVAAPTEQSSPAAALRRRRRRRLPPHPCWAHCCAVDSGVERPYLVDKVSRLASCMCPSPAKQGLPPVGLQHARGARTLMPAACVPLPKACRAQWT